MGLDKTTVPLAVFKNHAPSEVRFITTVEVERYMQRLAVHVYKFHPINDKAAIAKFTSHSLRVGACVILHGMGFKAHDIQSLLRWKSQAFLTYLRNLVIVADRHARALTDASQMPAFV